MSKDIYNSEDELLKDIKSDIEKTLDKEVLDEVKEIEIEHVQRDVFAVYKPKIYKRRIEDGIDDSENIVGEVKDMELTVDNITQFNVGYNTKNYGFGLPDLINYGHGNPYHYDYLPFGPRPFWDNTEKEIDNTDRVDKALEEGLKKIGYDIN